MNYKKLASERVDVKFTCPICGQEIRMVRSVRDLPLENTMADNVLDMIGRGVFPQRCSRCNRRYDIQIYVRRAEYYAEAIDLINRHRIQASLEEDN